MTPKYFDQDDIFAMICAEVMEEYNIYMEEEGEKSVGADELEALSREVSMIGNDEIHSEAQKEEWSCHEIDISEGE